MSLVVWLPLTKDLRQQGLSNIKVENHNATLNTAGKLGSCYYFNGSQQWLQFDTVLGDYYNNDWSIACWLKPTDSTRSVIISEYSSTGASNVGLELTASRVVRLYWNGSPDINFTTAGALPINEWTHLTVTKQARVVKVYFNGELKQTYTNSSDFSTRTSASYPRIGDDYRGNSANTVSYQGYINDFRMYDHCLSPMEVKELAKGLVLHYDLSDAAIESTTNLITNADCLSNTCYNGATGKYGYGTNTDMYKTITTYDGRKGTKVYMGTNGNNCYPYVYVNSMYTSNGTNSPEYKTLSFDYYTTISTSISPYKLGSGNGTATYKVIANGLERTGTGTNSVVIPIIPNTWNHVEVTFHGTTDADAQWGYIQNQPTHVSNTNNFWFFANMQLETKDHATAYAGVGGSRTVNTVYDSSGFCNNGTISGALTIASDTPKYKYSIQMPAAATISHARCLDNTNQEWSCAAWVKPTTAGNYQNLNNFNESNRLYHGTYPLLYANSGTNDYYNYGNLALPANQWSHIVFVFKNSTGTKLIYINGENHTNTSGPNKTSTPKGIPDTVVIGSSNYEGSLCDYREYATALSADDVKSLYQNCATIDPDGTIRGQIRD